MLAKCTYGESRTFLIKYRNRFKIEGTSAETKKSVNDHLLYSDLLNSPGLVFNDQ